MDPFRMRSKIISGWLVFLAVILSSQLGLAQEDIIQALKSQLSDIQNQLKNALQRIDQLEKETSKNRFSRSRLRRGL